MDTLVTVGVPVAVITTFIAIVYLRNRSKGKRSKPLEEVEIPKFTYEALQEDSEQRALFLDWMNKEGFTVLTLNDDLQNQIELYWNLTQNFFSKSLEYKTQYRGKPKYKDEIFGGKRQVNKGFLTIKEKEFLKLCLDDPSQTLPEDIEGFEETFCKLCEELEEIMKFLYITVASSIDPVSKKPVHDKEAMDVVLDCIRKGSSVSMIDYQPIDSSEAITVETRDAPTEKTHFPSATHHDTGFLTMIMCSDVPALQIEDRVTGSWFMPEKICEPKKDCFVILGKKTEQFANFNHAGTKMFKATLHRVMMPYNQQRNSLLYFQDIPQ